MTRWELTKWVVFVAVSAVWRLEARGVAVWPQLHVSGCGLPLVGRDALIASCMYLDGMPDSPDATRRHLEIRLVFSFA